jgi:prepilin-type N-terminal cleavage/methylation domain-containing protein
MKHKGFSIVELATVMLIISILAVLSVVYVTRTQLVARDKERLDDVNTISSLFEDIYADGRPSGKTIPESTTAVGADAVPLSYPSTSLLSVNNVQSQAILDQIDQRARTSPKGALGAGLVAASTNADMSGSTVGGRTLNASNDFYVFQPRLADGNLCTVAMTADPTRQVIASRLVGLCKSFSIYYFSETENIIKEIKSQRKNSDASF